MADEYEAEDPASRRARLKALRRGRKQGPRPMGISGKSVFLLKQLAEDRVRAAKKQAARG